jgi:hypothetical protein
MGLCAFFAPWAVQPAGDGGWRGEMPEASTGPLPEAIRRFEQVLRVRVAEALRLKTEKTARKCRKERLTLSAFEKYRKIL